MSDADIQSYLDWINSKFPCNEILSKTEDMGALFLGSKEGAMKKNITEKEIKAIVQCAGGLEDFYPPWGRQLLKMKSDNLIDLMQMGWADEPAQRLTNLAEALTFIHNKRKAQENVLVNCAQGKSRSSTLVIAYLIVAEQQSFKDALAFTVKRRSIAEPNSGFEKQLIELESSPNRLAELRKCLA